METYETAAGNILEVYEEAAGDDTSWYEFILREKRPVGEQVTQLLKARLIYPDYYIEKFRREN